MKYIISVIKNAFDFSETEARGFVVLSSILCSFIFLPFARELLPEKQVITDAEDQRMLDSIVTVLQTDLVVNKPNRVNKQKQSSPRLFRFDPNLISGTELNALGIDRSVIKRIEHYRMKGGKFRIKKDFAKIYGLTPQKYEELKPFLLLPDSSVRALKQSSLSVVELPKDINRADTTELMALRGIGSKRAATIIKFRDKLGGFVKAGQFREIYGLDSFALSELEKRFTIDRAFIPRKIDWNELRSKSDFGHPYLSNKQVAILKSYLEQHGGAIKDKEEFMKLVGIPDTVKWKLEPYLLFLSE